MTTLDARIKALEATVGGTAVAHAIVVRFYAVAEEVPLTMLGCGNWKATRNDGETDSDFIARARREAPAPRPNCALVLFAQL